MTTVFVNPADGFRVDTLEGNASIIVTDRNGRSGAVLLFHPGKLAELYTAIGTALATRAQLDPGAGCAVTHVSAPPTETDPRNGDLSRFVCHAGHDELAQAHAAGVVL